MGEEGDRKAFISRIGTFFLLVGALLVLIYIASDISRADQGRIAGATQMYIVQGVQALQTRDAGALAAKQAGQPTPTLALPPTTETSPLNYLPMFCMGAIILGLGAFFKYKTAPPSTPGKRFDGIRKWQQKRREAKAKKEAARKEKGPPKKK
jgi:hypothetical protein